MARLTIRVVGEHDDDDRTECTHKVTSVGKPKEAGCTGRTAYSARCSCGWRSAPMLRTLANEARDRHRRDHATKPTPAEAGAAR
ncbi:hypothetical protein [Streptomyces aidingensis]|uniref:Uncharacterized protein n=1 Tax=Streptomyces aidingensis TaxID=910347 RepID=A0A1I1UWU1_9ACTN|nr:hypothetical protein [Streptomyces aidingensis]SFD74168.1 hypothetical protein SAMN05421773_12710 [Streptomyces aidingensis]